MSRTAAFLRRQAAVKRTEAKETETQRRDDAVNPKDRQSCLFDPSPPNTSGKE